MPPLNLTLADEALTAAAGKLRKTLPAAYPTDEELVYSGVPPARRPAVVGQVANVAEDLLRLAVRREAEAREAQELAVRALRHLGAISPNWERIGDLTGMSRAGAHKRFAAGARRPRAQLTIDDAQEAAA